MRERSLQFRFLLTVMSAIFIVTIFVGGLSIYEVDNVKFPISIAKGFAEFDPERDTQFSDVFERADGEMYNNKRDMKNFKN